MRLNSNSSIFNCLQNLFLLSFLLATFSAHAGPFVLKELIWQKGGNPNYSLQPPLGHPLTHIF
jgi:hypothetical protein